MYYYPLSIALLSTESCFVISCSLLSTESCIVISCALLSNVSCIVISCTGENSALHRKGIAGCCTVEYSALYNGFQCTFSRTRLSSIQHNVSLVQNTVIPASLHLNSSESFFLYSILYISLLQTAFCLPPPNLTLLAYFVQHSTLLSLYSHYYPVSLQKLLVYM